MIAQCRGQSGNIVLLRYKALQGIVRSRDLVLLIITRLVTNGCPTVLCNFRALNVAKSVIRAHWTDDRYYRRLNGSLDPN